MTLQLLWEQPGLPQQQELPEELRERYGGGLGFDEPCVYANFVETIDGVVAIPGLEQSNALVADSSEDDRFLMGLLRAFAAASAGKTSEPVRAKGLVNGVERYLRCAVSLLRSSDGERRLLFSAMHLFRPEEDS